MRRIVITGMGAVSPIGNTVAENFTALKQGKCGIAPITHFDTTDRKVKVAGEAKNLNMEDFLPKKEIRRMDRFVAFALIAAEEAMQDAGIKPEEIEYINAHGTSTLLNDSCETMAIKQAFGAHAYKLMMSSTKSMTGHLLGASGAIEAVFTTLAVKEGYIPPTINYRVPDDVCDLDIVANEGRNIDISYAMSNSLGFGGHNASLIIRKY